MSVIKWLSNWYKNNCDGDWEHSYGISIDTLDNPGWRVDINLIDTPLEGIEFDITEIYVNDSDWMYCCVKDEVFIGRGSTDKLEEILKIFKAWVEKNN